MNFIKTKLNKITKKELKIAKKEKKRCQKLYSDWKDDEYNCGPLKFIWGVLSPDNMSSDTSNTYTLNDLDIMYNRDTHKYLLGLETIYSFSTYEENLTYLNSLLNQFYKFVKIQLDANIEPFSLHQYNDGNLFIADSITELYYKFKIFVKGYESL